MSPEVEYHKSSRISDITKVNGLSSLVIGLYLHKDGLHETNNHEVTRWNKDTERGLTQEQTDYFVWPCFHWG